MALALTRPLVLCLCAQGYAELLVQQEIQQQVKPNLLTPSGRSLGTQAAAKWAANSEISLVPRRGKRHPNPKSGRNEDDDDDKVEALLQRQNREPPENRTPIQALHDRLREAEGRADVAEVACTKKQIQLDETHAKWRAAEAKLEEEKAWRHSKQGARDMVTVTIFSPLGPPTPLLSRWGVC